jgi:hypothetical protein
MATDAHMQLNGWIVEEFQETIATVDENPRQERSAREYVPHRTEGR